MRTGGLITYRVTSENQPELSRFLKVTTASLGVAEPATAELYPVPAVQAGTSLLIGLPLVLGLDARELAEVVGQELVCRTRQRALVRAGGGDAPGELTSQAVAD